ncbi:uncharacterized protein LOC129921301 [Episyrphus balteatus]|uniref:uncharacterized protein LOC129921301 n=1 Tax=Episyrphus balteatus TaxID=286459 RepID=UPI0024854A41|nr:uncharacterized protein LOC129921301 [Episyrphus balteatus]
MKQTEPKEGLLYYLGMEIHLKQNGIMVTQQKHTNKVLNRYGFNEAYPVKTPIEPGMLTEKHTNDEPLKNKHYREVIGSLLYLSTISRPDISFTINYLSRQVNNQKISHWKMIERVLRYLKGTTNFGIHFGNEAKLRAYADSNYSGTEPDMISTSGILVYYSGPIVWMAQKQSVVSISSAEAEYRSAASCKQEVCWIRRIMQELGITIKEPTKLFIDNKAAIHMLENADEGKITKAKKHIEIQCGSHG